MKCTNEVISSTMSGKEEEEASEQVVSEVRNHDSLSLTLSLTHSLAAFAGCVNVVVACVSLVLLALGPDFEREVLCSSHLVC